MKAAWTMYVGTCRRREDKSLSSPSSYLSSVENMLLGFGRPWCGHLGGRLRNDVDGKEIRSVVVKGVAVNGNSGTVDSNFSDGSSPDCHLNRRHAGMLDGRLKENRLGRLE
jgi:hypothetical protein